MTTEDLIEKVRRNPVLFACGAVMLLCALLFYFRMDVISNLETERDDTLKRACLVEDNITSGASLQLHLADMKVHVKQLEERLVRPAELAVNLKYFYKLESETSVTLGDLRQAMALAKPAKEETYIGVGYDVILSGSFPQVVSFMNELEQGERFFRLRSFNLQRGRESGQPTLSLAMNVQLLGTP